MTLLLVLDGICFVLKSFTDNGLFRNPMRPETSTSPIDDTLGEVITPESTKAVLDVDMRLGQLETEVQE